MGNVSKNNSRHVIGGTKGLQMLYCIRPYVNGYSQIERKTFDWGKLLETHTN
jgi:hypothetical protein